MTHTVKPPPSKIPFAHNQLTVFPRAGYIVRNRTGNKVGTANRPLTEHPYLSFKLNNKTVYVHRIIWSAIHHRAVPSGYDIDHIDENTLNNKYSNLRLLTHRQNVQRQTRVF